MNADHRRLLLEAYRRQADTIILARQHPVTGLLPASTAITVHGDYTHAWVRDNVYSILAVWALALACRRHDPGSAPALERSTARLMRGLLAAMLKQAHKVERFKHTQHPLDALHAKYATDTGEPVKGDAEWGHLQIDATALWVLMLAQMQEAGLAVIETAAEVAFVQNLVHYLSRAHRTPDYGIWERGHKRNDGVAEVNASSVGMAKAALEAIGGRELLPGRAPAIQVLADDVADMRRTLEALLPRESISKETDAALLAVVGFPAFAVEDAALAERTRTEIVAKLAGRYGCKRFLRDGHQTVVEDHARLHYEPGELSRFEGIESEWPLFFTYLLLDALWRGDDAAAAGWRERLEGLMQEQDGLRLLPELYVVPADRIEAERANPGSQPRVPNENLPLVWAQSLYLVGALLQDGYVEPEALLPIRRPARVAPPRVLVAPLACDTTVQWRLAARGLVAQSLDEPGLPAVCPPEALAAAFEQVGAEPSLGLGGRPRRRLGSLTTSRVVWTGDAVPRLVLPAFLDRREGHLAHDARLLAAELAAEVAHLRSHWREEAPPLLLLPIEGRLLDADGAEALLRTLASLEAEGVIETGPLEALWPHAATLQLDGLAAWPQADADADADAAGHGHGQGHGDGHGHADAHADAAADGRRGPMAAILTRPLDAAPWDEAATRPLSPARAARLAQQEDGELERLLRRSRNPHEQLDALTLLAQRERATPQHRALAEAIHARAVRERRWGLLRRAAGLFGRHDDRLEDAVARLLQHQKQLALGRAYSPGSVVVQPLAQAELVACIERYGGDDPASRLLIEEVVLLLATLMKADAALFEGTLTLRPWYLVQLLVGWLAREHDIAPAQAYEHLMELSPHALLGRLREVIAREQEMSQNLRRQQSLHWTGGGPVVQLSFAPVDDPVLGDDEGGWTAWRQLTGVIGRVPVDFHVRVWELLQHYPGLVIGDQLDARNRLDGLLARADMTASERAFALQVEDLLERIHAPEYRQLTIEALMTASDLCRANPDMVVTDDLVLDVVVGIAVRLGWEATPPAQGADYNDHRAEAWQAFYAAPPHEVANLVARALSTLWEQRGERVRVDPRASRSESGDGGDIAAGAAAVGGGATGAPNK